ncbi:MAG: site-specific integrase [Planctomycetota bacterium]
MSPADPSHVPSVSDPPLTLRTLVTLHLRHKRQTCRKNGKPTRHAANIQPKLERVLGIVITPDALYDGRAANCAAGRDLATLPPADLTCADLEDALRIIGNRPVGRGGKPLKLDQLNLHRQYVLGMYRWASSRKLNLVDRSVYDRLTDTDRVTPGQTAAVESEEVPPVPDDVIDQLVTFLRRRSATLPDNSRYQRRMRRGALLRAIAIELMRGAGMRPMELVILRPVDVTRDPDSGLWLYRPPHHKNEHRRIDRVVVLSEHAKSLVDEAVAANTHDGAQGVFTFDQEFDPKTRLFPWRSESYEVARGCFAQAMRRDLKAAGLPHYTPNQLRHTFATWAVDRDPEAARNQLGHRHMSTTMKYVPDRRVAAAARLFDGGPTRPRPTDPTRPTPPASTGTDDPTPWQLRLTAD